MEPVESTLSQVASQVLNQTLNTLVMESMTFTHFGWILESLGCECAGNGNVGHQTNGCGGIILIGDLSYRQEGEK